MNVLIIMMMMMIIIIIIIIIKVRITDNDMHGMKNKYK